MARRMNTTGEGPTDSRVLQKLANCRIFCIQNDENIVINCKEMARTSRKIGIDRPLEKKSAKLKTGQL